MKRIVILSGSERRHSFFRVFMALSPHIEVVRSYCEGTEKSLQNIVSQQPSQGLRMRHLLSREQSERDFFSLFLEHVPDRSHPVFIPKGNINLAAQTSAILQLTPDILVAYGCSIIKGPLLDSFPRRFINVHLGLSPYYRGSGTNLWPLVNGEPECIGATFMHIDAGIDTGEIIHQIRGRVFPYDTPATLGNRLIKDTAAACRSLVERFDTLRKMPQQAREVQGRFYRKSDFTEDTVHAVYKNLADGLLERYLQEQDVRTARTPIVINPAMEDVTAS